MSGLNLVVRERRDADVPFIKSSWRTSYEDFRRDWGTSPNPNVLWPTKDEYHCYMLYRIKRMLPHAQFLVACFEDDTSEIIGWACYGPNVLHYVYVKEAFRGSGVATKLVKATELEEPYWVTHWTRAVAKIGKPILYDPGLLREDLKTKKRAREASRRWKENQVRK